MFERFTKEAKAAVTAAQTEAAERLDNRIGSEHLLIGVLETSPDVTEMLTVEQAREALVAMDVSALEAVGISLEAVVTGQEPKRKRHIPFTGSAKSVLENSLREAISAGDRKIEGHHILLAITTLPAQDRAVRLIKECGVSSPELRSALLTLRREAS